MLFTDLPLSQPILRAVADQGYTIATPIQAQTLPHVLAGKDVVGCAQTGTGKTAAFALPALHRLSTNPRIKGSRGPRCLILCPTRELAGQIADSFRDYGKGLKLYFSVVFGGVSPYHQIKQLQRGVDVLIATPGRLMDLSRGGHVDLRALEMLVLDEADRMLDMGFIHDIRKIVEMTPDARQTLLFSATMPAEIRRLANAFLREPVEIHVAPPSTTAERIDQTVYFVSPEHKPALLTHVLRSKPIERAIVFTRTKHGADKVVRKLYQDGVRAAAIHGNKSQSQRQRALDQFRSGRAPVLIATDIASRGIDVDGISHVINYDLPPDPESYVHRIGRTARAGASGSALSLVTPDEHGFLRGIERLTRLSIPHADDHPADIPAATAPAARQATANSSRGNGRPRTGGGNGQRNGGGAGGNNRPSFPRNGRPSGPRPAGKPANGGKPRGPRRSAV